jgi:hypothetical protein
VIISCLLARPCGERKPVRASLPHRSCGVAVCGPCQCRQSGFAVFLAIETQRLVAHYIGLAFNVDGSKQSDATGGRQGCEPETGLEGARGESPTDPHKFASPDVTARALTQVEQASISNGHIIVGTKDVWCILLPPAEGALQTSIRTVKSLWVQTVLANVVQGFVISAHWKCQKIHS